MVLMAMGANLTVKSCLDNNGTHGCQPISELA